MKIQIHFKEERLSWEPSLLFKHLPRTLFTQGQNTVAETTVVSMDKATT